MKKYLVMKCRELDDQYECDVERFPICITDNWKAFDGMFPMEVYEIEENGNIGKRIREWDDPANAEKEWCLVIGLKILENLLSKRSLLTANLPMAFPQK